jgi:hypothetical protein
VRAAGYARTVGSLYPIARDRGARARGANRDVADKAGPQAAASQVGNMRGKIQGIAEVEVDAEIAQDMDTKTVQDVGIVARLT